MTKRRRALWWMVALMPIVALSFVLQRLASRVPRVLFTHYHVERIRVSADGYLLLLQLDLTSPSGSGTYVPGYAVWNVRSQTMEFVRRGISLDWPLIWDQKNGAVIQAESKSAFPTENPRDASHQATVRLMWTTLANGKRKVAATHVVRSDGACYACLRKFICCVGYSDWCRTMKDQIGYSPDGSCIRVLTGPIITEFDAASGKFLRDIPLVPASQKARGSLLSPDGRVLLDDYEKADEVTLVRLGSAQRSYLESNGFASYGIREDRFSPDGRLVALSDRNTAISAEPEGTRIYNSRTLDLLWDRSPERFAAFSPDGGEVFTFDTTPPKLKVRDARSGKLKKELRGIQSANIAVSPDGRWLYEARSDRVIRWCLDWPNAPPSRPAAVHFSNSAVPQTKLFPGPRTW